MQDLVPATQVADLLDAIRAALDPPPAADYEGMQARKELLVTRCAYIAGALSADTCHMPSPGLFLDLAGQPLPYKPAGGAA